MERGRLRGSLIIASVVASIMLFVTSQAYSANQDFKDNKKENGTARCTDGIDNDLDGLIDVCDPDCTKNRNEKKLLKWAACTVDEEPLPDEDPSPWTPEGNLLLNPSADLGFNYWFGWGDTGTGLFDDNDPAFYVHRDISSSHMSQDYLLPRGSAGKYVVFAGYVMTEEDNEDYQKALIKAYFMDSPNTIIYPMPRADISDPWCGFGCWQPIWGVHQIPNRITQIRVFLDEFHRMGDGPTTAYFDDVEMRLFDSPEEAYDFIDGYIFTHPEAIR